MDMENAALKAELRRRDEQISEEQWQGLPFAD
jgi:hypothetical protein